MRLLIFAKAPSPGLAKTRLQPILGAEKTAALAHLMLQHTLAAALEANLGEVELLLEPAYPAPPWPQMAFPKQVRLSAQGPGNLGERMARAAQRAPGAMLLLGTDCLEMHSHLLQEAAQLLRQHQAVLYPTHDGGYALLGLQQCAPNLFSDIPWSTSAVAAITLSRLQQLQWCFHVGTTLHDLDTPEDLLQLIASHPSSQPLYAARSLATSIRSWLGTAIN
ncbi:TIGR04282 family arsenosugar biosynthesis glycosyltransferase [Candidatus Magnetaquicoccus inordinatus]|uniref:TIGR04282 family arsenosugar biosynthesis glycosyltransferase n=1 Tax=Candidatus Magnetaquicoccus inordinatus TaxID=2496818 RepID=UPI00102C89F5|nr:TIGR04282 family arsenosugar biosynthesis glycosyltransferase [Candidatus Magnetaquicoccus inordinatus]